MSSLTYVSLFDFLGIKHINIYSSFLPFKTRYIVTIRTLPTNNWKLGFHLELFAIPANN